mmetsp:Transcript_15855/g.35283  ORF Transcript_15855/g.35283 Transcript_15855/m.35283 type:complete len:298 (-) Transcript_15855:87-980(-)
MTRKSKQPGGHNPLTAHERKKLLGSYGTTSVRLGSAAQRRFGDCALGLTPAIDPVCTPSGNIYSREAIVSYLLAKTQELKQLRTERDAEEAERLKRAAQSEEEARKKAAKDFKVKDQGAARSDVGTHGQSYGAALGKRISTESAEAGRETLKRTSYWLSDFTPDAGRKTTGEDDEESGESSTRKEPIPDRPPSPMTGEPLRRKDLISIELSREEGTKGNVTCAVSGKAITTQDAIVIKKTGKVMLLDVYEKVVKPDMTCPVTGRKFKEKDVIPLQKAASGFAASGEVVAKRYKPTMT